MENSLTVALARQSVLARQMDVIATNLANVTTAGFKAENMIFTEHVEQSDTGEILSLVHDVGFIRDTSEGPMTATKNPLDLAIAGQGFFAVQTPEGPRYTRHGAFRLDDLGRVVTTEGHPVLGAGGASIIVPPETARIEIRRDGTISADAAEIGRIAVFRFDDEQALSKLGSGLYDAEGQIAQPASDAEVLQGTIEGSNVSGVTEMARMIDVVRSYEAAARMADTEHQRILDAIEALIETA